MQFVLIFFGLGALALALGGGWLLKQRWQILQQKQRFRQQLLDERLAAAAGLSEPQRIASQKRGVPLKSASTRKSQPQTPSKKPPGKKEHTGKKEHKKESKKEKPSVFSVFWSATNCLASYWAILLGVKNTPQPLTYDGDLFRAHPVLHGPGLPVDGKGLFFKGCLRALGQSQGHHRIVQAVVH